MKKIFVKSFFAVLALLATVTTVSAQNEWMNPDEWVEVTPDMWHQWGSKADPTHCKGDAVITGDMTPAWNLNADIGAGSTILGDENVSWNLYADLSGYDKLIIFGTGGPGMRLMCNRIIDEGAWKNLVVGFNADDSHWNADFECLVIDLNEIKTMTCTANGDGDPEGVKTGDERIDDFVHLHCFKNAWGGQFPINISGIYLWKGSGGSSSEGGGSSSEGGGSSSELDAAISALEAVLSALPEDILVDDGKKDPVKLAELQRLIANAQSGIANGTLTAEEARSLAQQILELKDKLTLDEGWMNPDEWVEVTHDMWHQWGSEADPTHCKKDAVITGEMYPAWNLNTDIGAGACILGTENFIWNQYADISEYDKLIIFGSGGPGMRVMCNRIIDEGAWKNLVVGFNADDSHWNADLECLVIDLNEIKTMTCTANGDGDPEDVKTGDERVDDFVHLHCFKNAWGGQFPINVSAIYLWKAGDGSSSGGGGAYTELESVLSALPEDILIDNGKKDPIKIAELEQLIASAQSGIANGTLTLAEARNLAKQILILKEKLSQVYQVINVVERGTLGNLILEKTENFSDVKGIRLSGRLDDDDIYTLKSRLTELTEADLEGLDWENIPSELFSGRYSLEKVVLPANVKTIGTYAFYNCQALSDITLREGITEIGEYAFNRAGLKNLTLPSTLKEIKYCTFSGCDNLKTITFNGQERIRNEAFYNCDKLTSIALPITMRTIESNAFAYCYNLENIELNDGLETIDYYAFWGSRCSKIILPSTLNNIGNRALGDNYTLQEITCLAVVPPVLNNDYLMDNPYNCTLYVPSISLNEYKQAVGWDKFNVVGIDILPDRINITRDYHLNWPDAVSANYKPQVAVTSIEHNSYNYSWERRSFGSLSVEGKSTLSMSDFTIVNDLYWQYNYYYNNDAKLSASLINNGVMRADDIQQKLVLPGYQWCFVTIPFDVKVSDIIQQGTDYPYVIRKYDGELRAQGKTGETWVNVTANDTLHAGQGYIWQVGGDNESTFLLNALQTVNKNNIFVNTDVEVVLNYYESEFAHNRSWNLIGNPYPSYYDIRAMKTTAPITIWNIYNWNYEAYSPADDEYILSPGQAFFVQRPLNEESITFLKKGRQTNMKIRDVDYDTKRAASMVERKVFNLTLTGNNLSDRTRFVINDDANMDYEAGRDASKFMSLDQRAVQLYTCQGTIRYAINERPMGNGIVELGLSIGTAGTYTLALTTKAGDEVYLIDRLNNTITRMDGTDGYTFNASQDSLEGRFAIQFGNAGTTGIDTIGTMEQTNGTYYNLNGQRVAQPTKGLYIQNGKKVIKK